MTTSDTKNAELAHDLQLGIARTSIPDFQQLPLIGMASILAIHIRGLGEIDYGVLRQVSDHFFDIPAMVLDQPLKILEEVGFVALVTEGRTIKKVIPSVPHFDSVYAALGQYLASQSLTEHEQLSLAILDELSSKPEKRDTLLGRLNADTRVFGRCESIVEEGGLLISKRSRGQTILVSPAYFADNLDSLADLAATGGARRIEKILKLISTSQGWPLSMIEKQAELNGTKLSQDELGILRALVSDGVLKPPSIERPNKKAEHFVFTPRPGKIRLNATNREIYERAMGLVAAVRKGQLLPEQYRIRSPEAILSALRDRKRIGANSEAAHQYRNLVSLRIGRLQKTQSDRYQFVLIETPENLKAVDEALSLIRYGGTAQVGVDQEALIALTQDEKYIQSIVASAKFRQIGKTELKPDEKAEIEQLLLRF
jgi:hypothetical protein